MRKKDRGRNTCNKGNGRRRILPRVPARPLSDVDTAAAPAYGPDAVMRDRINNCNLLSPIGLQELVSECSVESNVQYQTLLLTQAMRAMLGGREPHEQQVRAVRRLVYGFGDTILVARTGFGKSVVLHAYSVLTGNITLQMLCVGRALVTRQPTAQWQQHEASRRLKKRERSSLGQQTTAALMRGVYGVFGGC